MTPRDAAIAAYAEAERRMRAEARAARLAGAPLTYRLMRQKALMCHRAMLAEMTEVDVRRAA